MALYSVTIVARSLAEATALRAMDLDLHERAAQQRPDTGEVAVPAILDDATIERVRAAGYRVEIEQDLDQVAAERAGEVDRTTDRFAAGNRAARNAARSDEDTAATRRALETLLDLSDVGEADEGPARAVLGGYLTPDEVESALAVLAASYPGLAVVEALPEPSWEGRTTQFLRVRSDGAAGKPGVLITGSMHAREWGGSDICLAFVTNLLKSYQAGSALTYGNRTFTAADVKAIVEQLELVVYPDVNPDGKAFSQSHDPASGSAQEMWWRKNRNPNAGLPGGFRGVDVNRNFDFLWSSGIGTSAAPQSFTYKGQAAFSEPESRNVRALLDMHPRIAYYVDVHSFGGLILFSWGDDDNQSTDPAQNFENPAFQGVRGIAKDTAYREFIPPADASANQALANAMNLALQGVRGRSYQVQQAVGLYPTSATSDDYAFSRHLVDGALGKVYAFTIEFGAQFVPPYPEMRRVMADVAAALTELCRRAAT